MKRSAVVLVLLLVLTACGGDNKASGPTTVADPPDVVTEWCGLIREWAEVDQQTDVKGPGQLAAFDRYFALYDEVARTVPPSLSPEMDVMVKVREDTVIASDAASRRLAVLKLDSFVTLRCDVRLSFEGKDFPLVRDHLAGLR